MLMGVGFSLWSDENVKKEISNDDCIAMNIVRSPKRSTLKG